MSQTTVMIITEQSFKDSFLNDQTKLQEAIKTTLFPNGEYVRYAFVADQNSLNKTGKIVSAMHNIGFQNSFQWKSNEIIGGGIVNESKRMSDEKFMVLAIVSSETLDKEGFEKQFIEKGLVVELIKAREYAEV